MLALLVGRGQTWLVVVTSPHWPIPMCVVDVETMSKATAHIPIFVYVCWYFQHKADVLHGVVSKMDTGPSYMLICFNAGIRPSEPVIISKDYTEIGSHMAKNVLELRLLVLTSSSSPPVPPIQVRSVTWVYRPTWLTHC